jgi:hypothetical protein
LKRLKNSGRNYSFTRSVMPVVLKTAKGPAVQFDPVFQPCVAQRRNVLCTARDELLGAAAIATLWPFGIALLLVTG